MVLRLTKQKTIYKNLMKKVVFGIDWQIFQLENFQTKIKLQKIKKHKNVFYCFGHHHLGWTLGPISGKIISGMIAEENTNLNLKPYSSLRFS